MKKQPLAASLAALLLLSLPLAACTPSGNQTEGEETHEIQTIPPVTIPTEPDDRGFTDLTPYKTRLEDLFASAPVTPASHFTYEAAGENSVIITGYIGDKTGDTGETAGSGENMHALVVVIPDTIEGKAVVAIAEGAFADQTTIKAVSVPDSVEAIGVGAFKGCKNMTSLRTPVFTCAGAPYFGALFGASTHEANGYTVPTGLGTLVLTKGETIPACAFYACRNLEVVGLPEELTVIEDFAFYGCQSLAYIPTGETALKEVGQNVFTNCEKLLTLDIPASVQTLGFAMLEGCASLESLTLPFAGGYRVGRLATKDDLDGTGPAEATYLGYLFGASDYTFTKGFLPGRLISLTLREGCGDVAPNAFFECAGLREIILPDGVKTIGRRAFYGCEGLAEMTLPDSVTSIGDDAFHGCIRMTEFSAGGALTTLGVQAFMDCVSLTSATLPDTVTHLPNAAFAGCVSLQTLTANGVKTRGKQVFRHCGKLTGWDAAS